MVQSFEHLTLGFHSGPECRVVGSSSALGSTLSEYPGVWALKLTMLFGERPNSTMDNTVFY